MMTRYTLTAISLVVCWLLMACAPFTPKKRVHETGMLPATYSTKSLELDTLQKWWQTFNDEQLNDLVEEALSNSYSLQQNWKNVVKKPKKMKISRL